MYIVFEGIVGTGKSIQSRKLYDYLKEKYSDKKVVWTKEPGGTEIAQKIRECVQGTDFSEEMDPICEVYLYAASRAQTLRRVVKPVIECGGVVVSDRSFISALAFEGYGADTGINNVLKINRYAIDSVVPDLVVFLDLDPNICCERIFDKKGDKWERRGIEFFQKVRTGYTKISKLKMFNDKWITVKVTDAPVEQNFELILKSLKPFLKNV
jgi:dTMP kinase